MHELDLARDVMDKQLIDRDCTEMGRVDGVLLELSDGSPPRVDSFELGFVVLAERLHPRLLALLEWLRRWSVRKTARQVVQWSAVEEVTERYIKLSIDATETPAFDWEKWLGMHVVEHLPGGKEEE
ncbi:MAG: hypothetical protein QOI24_2248 [Acidobacteriota bacterium]|jgi:hypothetical protein|nr:hypothetical protein [Acidobacteriota bacterium]